MQKVDLQPEVFLHRNADVSEAMSCLASSFGVPLSHVVSGSAVRAQADLDAFFTTGFVEVYRLPGGVLPYLCKVYVDDGRFSDARLLGLARCLGVPVAANNAESDDFFRLTLYYRNAVRRDVPVSEVDGPDDETILESPEIDRIAAGA